MLLLKTKPKTRTIKKDRVIGYYLSNKKKYEQHVKIQSLLNDVLRTIE